MDKESLFKLIRNEEVIIWAGAGLSLYAGLPSGKRLCEILYENLSLTEQEQINPTLSLPNLAEEYCRLKANNKNSLIKILKKVFVDTTPVSTASHDQLSSIPHFKTIITTNYDQLIEKAFGQRGQILFAAKHIPYLEKEKTHIFKVHGDLSEPESIIITKSDYNHFFKMDNENDIYWTIIKKELSTNNVLFLGYDLEDPNTSVIFEKISDALNHHRKEWFLVAPNLKQHKINDLVTKGIQYINSTAEELINELIINLKENIIDDFDKEITSTETFRKFLKNNNILPVLKANSDSFKLHSLIGINGTIEGNANFTVKNDENFIEEFNDFFTGKKFGEFEISEDELIEANLKIAGLNFPIINGKSKFTFKSVPQKSTKIDIRFDDGFELSDIEVKIYGSQYAMEIHLVLISSILKIKIDPTIELKFNFEFEHCKSCRNVKEEIELFTLLNYLGANNHFVIYDQSKEIKLPILPLLPSLFAYSQHYLKYFENLKIIEQSYNIRFVNIELSSITEHLNKLVSTTVLVIKGESIVSDWDTEMCIDLIDDSKLTFEELKTFNDLNTSAYACNNQEEQIEIHGIKISLGFQKIEILEAYLSNLDSILAQKERTLKIKSKCKKIKISYTKAKEVGIIDSTISIT